jgi:8-oxo-dGTP pyrophosphatase MutT (NUDIX family)
VKEKLKQLLVQRQKRQIIDASRTPSAVLLPLYNKQGQYHLLFIKRSEKVKSHKGEISFPGGARDEQDTTLLDTTLRECAEEIGLNAEDIEILGEMDDETTITSSYIVTPFVGVIPWPYQFKGNKEEVDEIIEVPVPALLAHNCLHQETRLLDNQAVDFYTYHYQERVIWGATARILNRFLDIFTRAMQDG